MPERLKQSYQVALEFWSSRSLRERKLIAAMAALIVCSLIITAFILPALHGREQLRKKIPLLYAQASQIQALSEQLENYAASSKVTVARMSGNDFEAALQMHGLKPRSLNLTDNYVQVQLSDVALSDVIAWLADMQQRARITVSEANIVALAQPGRADAKIILQQYLAQ
jgi:type II secretory pathway component PulM